MRRALQGPAAFQRLLSSRGVIRRELTIDDPEHEQQLRETGIFCPSCFTFSKDLLSLSVPGGQVVGLPTDLDEPCEEAIIWEISIQRLVDAADNGCHLCAFVTTHVFDNRRGHYMGFATLAEEGPGLMGCCARAARSEPSERVRDSVGFLRRFLEWYPDAQFMTVGIPMDRDPVTAAYSKLWLCVRSSNVNEDANRMLMKMGGPPEIMLELYALKDDAAAPWIHSRPIQTKPGRYENIETVKSWIRECREDHPDCGQRSKKPCKLPTRLVRLLGDQRAEVYHPAENEVDQYLALSYLWGDPKNHEWKSSATLVANLTERKEGFDRGSLPKALRDALSITEALGMEYIWIDRLCIIQDSRDDKDRELKRMSQYYQNAYLTLTASTHSADDGFIEDTIGCPHHPDFPAHRDLLRTLVLCPDKEIGEVYFRQETPHNLAVEPINDRAWTFEERLLSPRYLMYGNRVLWQCRSAMHCDGGTQDWSLNPYVQEIHRLSLKLGRVIEETDVLSVPSVSSDECQELWHAIVSEYSRRQLTRPRDKLIAIGAVASELSMAMGQNVYMAGLWKNTLIYDLLWSTHPHLDPCRPEKQRAPSWSWASVDHAIRFDRLPPLDMSPIIEIDAEETVIQAFRERQFDLVPQGKLRLHCPALKMTDWGSDAVKRNCLMSGPDSPGQDILSIIAGGVERRSWRTDNKQFEFPENSIMAFFFAEPAGKQPMPADAPKLQPVQPEHRINKSSPGEMAASMLKAFPNQTGPVRLITIRDGAVTSVLNSQGKKGYTDELLENLRRMGLEFQHEELEYGHVSGPSPAVDRGASTLDRSGDSTPAVEAGPASGQSDTRPEETNASQKWYRTWGLVLVPTEEAGIFERVCAFADISGSSRSHLGRRQNNRRDPVS